MREIDVMGVLISPFALCLPMAVAGTWALIAVLRRINPAALPARGALLELALFTTLLSGLVLLLRRN
ncbi:DUF1656 domain-containing protein [Methylobacterium sp. CM6241]